jgi:hypothetical protein
MTHRRPLASALRILRGVALVALALPRVASGQT